MHAGLPVNTSFAILAHRMGATDYLLGWKFCRNLACKTEKMNKIKRSKAPITINN